MEEFNKMFEEAKKAKLNINDALEKLKQAHSTCNMQGKSKLTSEQLSEMNEEYKKVLALKKKLDEYRN